jgi:ABC-type enterochelin transport system substrate-binding protein
MTFDNPKYVEETKENYSQLANIFIFLKEDKEKKLRNYTDKEILNKLEKIDEEERNT